MTSLPISAGGVISHPKQKYHDGEADDHDDGISQVAHPELEDAPQQLMSQGVTHGRWAQAHRFVWPLRIKPQDPVVYHEFLSFVPEFPFRKMEFSGFSRVFPAQKFGESRPLFQGDLFARLRAASEFAAEGRANNGAGWPGEVLGPKFDERFLQELSFVQELLLLRKYPNFIVNMWNSPFFPVCSHEFYGSSVHQLEKMGVMKMKSDVLVTGSKW